MLLAAFIYSITSVVGKAAMLHADPVSFGALYFLLIGIATLFILKLAQPSGVKVFRQNFLPHILVAALMSIMIVTHFLALAKVEAAYMIAVKRTSILFGILFGAWLFHEYGLARNIFAASLMVAGVTIILLA